MHKMAAVWTPHGHSVGIRLDHKHLCQGPDESTCVQCRSCVGISKQTSRHSSRSTAKPNEPNEPYASEAQLAHRLQCDSCYSNLQSHFSNARGACAAIEIAP